jgi:hypothetical protein
VPLTGAVAARRSQDPVRGGKLVWADSSAAPQNVDCGDDA